jgi:hypothetical protein
MKYVITASFPVFYSSSHTAIFSPHLTIANDCDVETGHLICVYAYIVHTHASCSKNKRFVITASF